MPRPSVIPAAALGLILVSALRIGREIPIPSPEFVLAVAALVAAVVFRVNPTLLLLGGGVIGALFLRGPAKGPT